MPAYDGTSISVGQSQREVDELLEKRGVVDIRWTQTSAIKALEFNYPVRDYLGTERVRSKNHRMVTRPKWTEIRVILGIHIAVPWTIDPQQQRRIMRVLFWSLKTKFEVIDGGLTVFEQEFMPHLTIGGGRSMYDRFKPQLEAAIKDRKDLSAGIGDAGLNALPEGERR